MLVKTLWFFNSWLSNSTAQEELRNKKNLHWLEMHADCSSEEESEIGLEECIKVKANRKGLLGILLLLVFPEPPYDHFISDIW